MHQNLIPNRALCWLGMNWGRWGVLPFGGNYLSYQFVLGENDINIYESYLLLTAFYVKRWDQKYWHRFESHRWSAGISIQMLGVPRPGTAVKGMGRILSSPPKHCTSNLRHLRRRNPPHRHHCSPGQALWNLWPTATDPIVFTDSSNKIIMISNF